MLNTMVICGRSQPRTARRNVTTQTESNETEPTAERISMRLAISGRSLNQTKAKVELATHRKAPLIKRRRPMRRPSQPRKRLTNNSAVQDANVLLLSLDGADLATATSTIAKLEATIAKLESARMRPHRSEKRPKVKLPPPVPPAPPAAAPRPNDDIRHAVLETAVEKLAVPEAKRTCPECSSTSLRAVGAGKTSTVYDYVGPHFRRRVCQRETLSCRCGEYIVTAAPLTIAAPAVEGRSRTFAGLEQLRDHALPGALTRLLSAMVPEDLRLRMDFGAWVPQKLDGEETLYRVCQEAVSNVIRHAQSRVLAVSAVVTDAHAVLQVTDEGRGIGSEFRPGLGLSSMRSRVEQAGGHFRITPNTPRGTLIEARLPRVDR